MYPFLPSTGSTLQCLAVTGEGVKLYLQGIFLVGKLLGDVSSVAPEREFVGVGCRGVGCPPIALDGLLGTFLALGWEL